MRRLREMLVSAAVLGFSLLRGSAAGAVMQPDDPEVLGTVSPRSESACGLSQKGEEPKLGISSITLGVKLTWEAEPGVEYVILWSPTLDPPAWRERGKVLGWKFGSACFFDPEPAGRLGFYRISEGRAMVFIPGSDGVWMDGPLPAALDLIRVAPGRGFRYHTRTARPQGVVEADRPNGAKYMGVRRPYD